MHLVASGDERLVELRDLTVALCNCEVTFGLLNKSYKIKNYIQWWKSKLLTNLLKIFDIIEGKFKIIKCSKY